MFLITGLLSLINTINSVNSINTINIYLDPINSTVLNNIVGMSFLVGDVLLLYSLCT